jgi:hypothetical protein
MSTPCANNILLLFTKLMIILHNIHKFENETPPNSLKDSNGSSKMKTIEEKGIGVLF